jgi:hypothetical protein
VQNAVEDAGATKAGTEIDAAEKNAAITVDSRYGQWKATSAHVLPPSSPAKVDVLNPSANGVGTATSSAVPTGQSS